MWAKDFFIKLHFILIFLTNENKKAFLKVSTFFRTLSSHNVLMDFYLSLYFILKIVQKILKIYINKND